MKKAVTRHAAILAFALGTVASQAAPAPAAGIISLSLDRAPDGRLLRVTFRNTTGRAQCLPRNWGAGSRLRATRGRAALVNNWDWEGRPIPGCDALPIGQTIGAVYRLDRMFASLRPGARLCYTIPWRADLRPRQLGWTTRCTIVR